MKDNSYYRLYEIRYYNVLFYLFAKTKIDDYKINVLGGYIKDGISVKMKDIHWWCFKHNIRYKTKFQYRNEYPIRANIWNLYSYCRFKIDNNL